jgi:hypothetical protein
VPGLESQEQRSTSEIEMFRVRVRSFSVRPDLSILNVPAMEAWRQGRTGEKKSVSNNMKPESP